LADREPEARHLDELVANTIGESVNFHGRHDDTSFKSGSLTQPTDSVEDGAKHAPAKGSIAIARFARNPDGSAMDGQASTARSPTLMSDREPAATIMNGRESGKAQFPERFELMRRATFLLTYPGSTITLSWLIQ
jgi:hypothetical protein